MSLCNLSRRRAQCPTLPRPRTPRRTPPPRVETTGARHHRRRRRIEARAIATDLVTDRVLESVIALIATGKEIVAARRGAIVPFHRGALIDLIVTVKARGTDSHFTRIVIVAVLV